jgi:RNA-binding protein
MLTGKQRRELRAKGHHLQPVVQVGKEGASETVVKSLDAALTTHELVKIKLGQSVSEPRHDMAETLAARTGSELVQVLGNTILLFRENPDKDADDEDSDGDDE